MGGGSFGEREDAIDDRLEFASSDELHHRVELRLRAHIGAEERKLAAEEETQIYLGIVARGGAAGNQAASGSKAREAVFPSGGSDVLEDNINPAFVGDAANFVANFLGFVIDEVVGAEFFGFGEFFVGASRGYDACAEEFRNLNGGAADAASSAKDQNIFGRLQLRASDEHVPSRLENQRNRGGFFPFEILRIGQTVHFGSADKFSAAAVNHVAEIGGLAAIVVEASKAGGALAAAYERGEDNLLANAHVGDVGANFGDFAGDVAAWDVRQRNRHVGQAAADPEVQMIQRASPDADENVIRAEGWLRRVFVLEYLWRAVLMENDCLHEAFALLRKSGKDNEQCTESDAH